MTRSQLAASFLIVMNVAFAINAFAQDHKPPHETSLVPADELNRQVPELFSDQFSLNIVLATLPGANDPLSHWEGDYEIYFIPETEFLRAFGSKISREYDQKSFPGKILLAEGNFGGDKLATLEDRTFRRTGIDFRSKIPPEQQTFWSRIMMFYSVKIHDGKLKKDITKTYLSMQGPYDNEMSLKGTLAPVESMNLDFFVSEYGSLAMSAKKLVPDPPKRTPDRKIAVTRFVEMPCPIFEATPFCFSISINIYRG